METNKSNTNAHLLSDSSGSKTSWADRSQVSNSIKNQNQTNKFSENECCIKERFFIVKREEGNFNQTSPFLINKSVQALIGEPKTIKKLRSGDLLIEVLNNKQAANLKICTKFANIPISVSPHRSLNTSRGVISEIDLLHVTDEEIVENLADQGVTEARRIKIFRRDEKIPANSTQIPTKHIILTFNSPNLPKNIKAGYLSCSIRPYIPNPLRCFRCQRFGHSKNSCRGNITCGRCGTVGHESVNCQSPVCCVNCKKGHPSYSKSCEYWQKEKEIQTLRTKENISYPEARKIVESRTPKAGVSYSAALSKTIHKTFQTIGTQTENLIENSVSEQKQSKTSYSNSASTSAQTVSPKSSQIPSMSSTPISTNTQNPSFLKYPVHKRNIEISTKTQPLKQNRRTENERHNLPNIKSSVSSEMSFKNKRNLKSKTNQHQTKKYPGKHKTNPKVQDVELEIHPNSDLSDNDGDSMCTTSETLT